MKQRTKKKPKVLRGPNPLRSDPTRTTTLRRMFMRALSVRFDRLKKQITKLVAEEDAFGLQQPEHLTFNRSAIAMLEIEDQTLRERVGDIQDLLDPEDVIELEDTPHVTVRYGLQDMTPQKVRQLLSRYPRVWIKLGRLSIFENDDVDVLKIDVQSEELHKVNRALGLHAAENTHRQYIPHVTIAFLKKGTGRKYLHGLPQFFYGMELLFKTMTYSSSGKEVTELALNKRWQFNTTPEQVQQFQRWLQQRFTEDIVAEAMQDMENAYWYRYIAEAYRKGAGKAFDDANARGLVDAEKQAGFYRGTKMEFLRSSFAQPVQIERVKTLAGRVLTELQGVTQSMATAMNRVLVDGLSQGKSPREVARELNNAVDKIGKNRALTIARTETIRAHAEGQLDSLTNLGIESVGVAVEWDTTGDGRVCPLCRPLDGIVLTVAEARGMLPRHPNCRCSWIPANVGEDGTKQKKQSAAIRAARDESIRAEGGKSSLLEKKKSTSWGGADKEFSKKRPKSIV